MTKKIFIYIFMSVFFAVLIECSFILLITNSVNNKEITNELETQLFNISNYFTKINDSENKINYLKILDTAHTTIRITWINYDGSVIYDSFTSPNEMENHLERKEIQDALKKGKGISDRFSKTNSKKTRYIATKLEDNTFLRVSTTFISELSLIASVVKPVLILVFIIMITSAILAIRMANRIVTPINNLDLIELKNSDEIKKKYPEIEPLIFKIENQKIEINKSITKLKKQQKEFEDITAFMKEGLVVLNNKNIILSANKSALNICNTNETSVIGKNIIFLNRDQNFLSLIDNNLTNKNIISEKKETEININNKFYKFSLNPVIEENILKGQVLLIVDITQEKLSENQRKEFTANVSHELKTPLTSIKGYAEIIKNGIAEKKDIPDFINKIFDESNRLLTLIEDIISLSHLDENSEKNLQKVNITEILNEVVFQLKPIAQNKNVKINFNNKNDEITQGNKIILHELFYNICENGIKYNKNNGTLDISINEKKEKVSTLNKINTSTIKNISKKIIEIKISDTGIGIQKEEQDRIFERFYRIEKSRSKDSGGTGLGLAIVKHAVQYHNGKISLKSKLGEGTSIIIQLPII